MADRIASRAFSALRWGYAGFATRAISSFVTGVVLARLLGPKPFGEVAAATLVYGLANLLADGGFSSALVQSPDLNEGDIRFAFTFQLTVGAVLTSIFMALAPVFGMLFRDPLVTGVVRATAVVFIIQAFGQSSAALLKRRLAFRPLQTAQVVSSLAGYAFVGITAAVLGAGVWSLVAAQITQATTFALLVFIFAGHSLKPSWNAAGLRLARFGTKVTGANILNWSISNFDNAFVGRAFGSTALGLYSRAFNTLSTPCDAVVSTWQQVLFASCSRLGDRTSARKRAYLASISAISLITFPVFWGVAACAGTVVAGLYGPRWMEAAPLLCPLAIAISLHSVMAMAGPMLQAADQVTREVQTQALSLAFAVAAFLFCVRYSAVALAWAVLAVYLFRLIVVSYSALRLLNVAWVEVLKGLRGSCVTGAITAAVVWGVSAAAKSHSVSPGRTLALLALAGMISTGGVLLLGTHRILSRDLVIALKQLSGSLPVRISQWLSSIDTKQARRESRVRTRSYNPDSLEATIS